MCIHVSLYPKYSDNLIISKLTLKIDQLPGPKITMPP